ncbi:MAG: DNA-binding protein [Bacteroidales bacterium]|jgi:predicted DNA-binding protein with PD1-like motif|nr:DNA-binding protein [Bacteroidales bacterium]MBQ2173488.1 DNA-binding protein [Bacteroidales bacterium]
MYKYKKVNVASPLGDWNERYVLSIDNHEEIMAALADFCKKKKIKAGDITGIGAISEATFRFLDPATKQYVDKVFEEQMEITNLTGNISSKEGEVYLHVHLTCSRRDYTCVGGHLLKARINGACELLVTDFGLTSVGRRFDPETGLNLYDF